MAGAAAPVAVGPPRFAMPFARPEKGLYWLGPEVCPEVEVELDRALWCAGTRPF